MEKQENVLQTDNNYSNPNTETNNTSILGVKRDRDVEEASNNIKIENKKSKSDDSIQYQAENNQVLNTNQQQKILNVHNQYQPTGYNLYGSNPTIINQHIPMHSVYGYTQQPQLFYYNQPHTMPAPMTGNLINQKKLILLI